MNQFHSGQKVTVCKPGVNPSFTFEVMEISQDGTYYLGEPGNHTYRVPVKATEIRLVAAEPRTIKFREFL